MSIIYAFFKAIEALVCAFIMGIGCLLAHLAITAIVFILFKNELLLMIVLNDLELFFIIYFVFHVIDIVQDDDFYESNFDI
jgi:uncharacterized Tic20 family protein|tara:strand:- start:652 stop:894 length:243 start_codon:yes stop_codon:yes gene_type:complete